MAQNRFSYLFGLSMALRPLTLDFELISVKWRARLYFERHRLYAAVQWRVIEHFSRQIYRRDSDVWGSLRPIEVPKHTLHKRTSRTWLSATTGLTNRTTYDSDHQITAISDTTSRLGLNFCSHIVMESTVISRVLLCFYLCSPIMQVRNHIIQDNSCTARKHILHRHFVTIPSNGPNHACLLNQHSTVKTWNKLLLLGPWHLMNSWLQNKSST